MFNNYPHDALFMGKYWNDLVTAKKEAMYDEIRKLDPDIFEANTIEEILFFETTFFISKEKLMHKKGDF